MLLHVTYDGIDVYNCQNEAAQVGLNVVFSSVIVEIGNSGCV